MWCLLTWTSFFFVLCVCMLPRSSTTTDFSAPSTPLALSLILRCLIVLQYLSSQKLTQNPFSFYLAPNHRKLSSSFVLSKLSDHSTCSCATSYKNSLLPYGKCAWERLRCVRRKRVFALLVCCFSHLKILIAPEKVHSCFKSQSELRILPLGSVIKLFFLWFKCLKRKFQVKIDRKI